MKTALYLAPSAIAVAIMASSLSVGVQAAGFVEDAKVTLGLRNYYFNRNYLNGTDPMIGPATNRERQGQAEGWTQSFILDARSGFTEGTVGFGLDVLGLYSIKLDGNRGAANTQLMPIHDDGQAADQFGRTAVAAKAKISKTELKVGEWFAVLPILRADDGRSLPQTFQGAQLTSNEIDGLTVYGGQFWKNSQRHDASREDMSFNGVAGDDFNFGGGEYRFNGNNTMVGVWHARLEDVYKQSYVQLTHSQPVGDWVLGANLGYVTGKEEGAAKAGKLDNKVYQGAFTAKTGNNTFTLAYQRLSGDTKFMRIDGASGGTLVNDGFTNSYDNPEERSWQIRHDYNFAGLGIPGLTLMNRYVSGSNIDVYTNGVKTRENAEEWGRESELAYTIQEGNLKNLSIRWRNSDVRRDGTAQDIHENRLIINYPLSLL
ncbi:Porin-like protein NicP precursor [Pseudomonas oleovorans subsp. oleovorans]|uniref:Outer membrane porin n=2 Tax=Ectopseudomonas oleovorans TaxID=301 RepID=A0A379JPD7_ECTOL|nr:OprD family porin [Pseudomonas oleovorans]OWK48497.1 Porin-like protein NicP precursor [Pseudomonas oleovorans subsp. oleovorans]SEJ26683.1 outer membrane porin, OprD family [Pseudomonas oleovorans]SUD50529.1 outer membrane porin [Pseudomonas oleovorans]